MDNNNSYNNNKKHSCGAGNSLYTIKSVSFNNVNFKKRKLENNNEETPSPINIYYDMTYLNQQKLNSSQDIIEKINMIDKAMSRCINIFKKLLKVKEPLKAPIKIKNEQDLKEWKFNSYKINKDLYPKSKGILCDLLILLRFKNENENIKYELPDASAVYIDEYTKRPILGILVINDEFEIKKNSQEYLEYLLLHGITHILGFSYNLFSSFPGKLANTILIEKETRTNKEKYKIKTPKVLAFAKKYFNCDKITGVELENNEESTNPSHWEARILLGEYMNSEPYTPEQVISEFTLALLEDSGWYQVNYYTGGLMRFGKNQGCDFINKDCLKYKSFIYEVNFKNEFCDPSINWVPSCSSGRQSRSYCSTELNEIDPDYQRFGNYRGRPNTDYCFINDFYPSEENLAHYVGNCKKGEGNYGSNILYNNNIKESNSHIPESFGEKYGNNSFCVLSSVIPKIKKENQIYNKYIDVIHSMCYPMFCTEKSLTIQINNQYIVCPREGGKIELVGEYFGELYCPDYNLICTGTIQCNDMFDCVEKESLAKSDTYEYDYIIQTSQHLPDLLKSEIMEGYEQSESKGKCPQNCNQCLENKKCIKCRSNYKLIGVYKNDENPIICKDIDISNLELYYKDNEDNTYYKCPDYCLNCKNEGICSICDNIHKLNKEKNICEEKVKNCQIYESNNEDCLLCKETYFFINDDKRHCYNHLDDKNKYYSEKNNSIYYSCHYGVPNCEKCLNKNICTKCKDNYFFINEERSICYNEIDRIRYYFEEDINTYYSCQYNLPNCEECLNKNECIKCKNNFFFINNDRTKCYNKLDDNNKYYSNENKTIYYSCNISIPHCETCLSKNECTKCEENYFFINEDRTKCYNTIDDEKKYYSEDNGKIYYSCSHNMKNCIECENKEKCLTCEENYYLSGKNSLCFPITTVPYEKCQIIFSNINENDRIFNDKNYILSLINDYINNYKDINYIIKHYSNFEMNYTITIFKASICTKLLLNSGFYYLDTNQILKKVNLDFFYNNDNYIHCFIKYGFQNYFTLYNTEINSFLNLSPLYNNISYTISNNITYDINSLLGKGISNLIKKNNINIFDKKESIFNNICNNFTIQGIDLPYKYRLNKLYLGNVSNELICTSDKCKMRSLFINNLTGVCQCNINEETDYLLNQPENIFLDIYHNSSAIGDSFKIFSCFNRNYRIISNAGATISLIFILIHILCISLYFVFNTKIYDFNTIGNPPKNKGLIIEDDLEDEKNKKENINSEIENGEISFSDYNNCDEEKKIQDKDIVYEFTNNGIYNKELKKELKYNEENKNNEIISSGNNTKENENYNYAKNVLDIISKNTEQNFSDLIINNNFRQNNNEIISEGRIITINKRGIKNRKKNELKSSENNELIDINENEKNKNIKDEFLEKNNSIIKINRIKKKNLRNINYINKNINSDNEEEKNSREINIKNDIIAKIEKKNNNSNSQTDEKINISFNTNMPEDNNKEKELMTDKDYEKYFDKNFKNLNRETTERFYFSNNNNSKDNNNIDNNGNIIQNKKFLILFNYENDEEKNANQNNSKIILNNNIIDDYFPYNKDKLNKKDFINLYWHILGLKQPIINIFSFVEFINIINNYVPLTIKINKFCFMITINLFINSMNLSQNYFFKKYEYFYKKQYNDEKIKSNEIIKYAMKNGFLKSFISFIICLVIYHLFEYIFFNYRKKLNKCLSEDNIDIKNLNKKIIELLKAIRNKIIIYICIASILLLLISIYLINFSFAYPGGISDCIANSIITFILLQIFAIIESLFICILRYYSIVKKKKSLYKISQLLF